MVQIELGLASAALSHGDKLGAQVVLRAVVAELDLFVRLRLLAAADEAPIKALLGRVIQSISR